MQVYSEAENEYITSKLLKGIFLPESFLYLRRALVYICDLNIMELQEEVEKFKKILLISDLPFLKMGLVKNYYEKGDNNLEENLIELLSKVEQVISEDRFISESLTIKNALKINDSVRNMRTVDDFTNSIASSQLDGTFIEKLQKDIKQLQICEQYIKTILDKKESKEKINLKEAYTKYDSNYITYLMNLKNLVDYSDINLVTTLFKAIGAIQQVIPKDSFHPFKLDECKNLVKCLMYPEDYHNFVKSEKIVSPSVASLFCNTYPATASFLLDLGYEKIDSKNYQEKINFRECFDIREDVSNITTSLI